MKVRLDCWSDQPHLSQVYTGLAMLHRAGEIELQQKVSPPPPLNADPECPPHLVDANTGHCTVEANGLRYCIDACDTHEIDAEALESCDVYLKRSYYAREPMSAKVRPLGLNYRVFADGFDLFELERRLKHGGMEAGSEILRASATNRLRLRGRCAEWRAPRAVPVPNVGARAGTRPR